MVCCSEVDTLYGVLTAQYAGLLILLTVQGFLVVNQTVVPAMSY